MKVGINGLGRVGRTLLRQLWERQTHVCSHINDINDDIENIVYLIVNDSNFGKFPGQVKVSAPRQITLQMHDRHWDIQLSDYSTIKEVNWSSVECVIDSSGIEDNAVAAREIINHKLSHVIITHTFAQSDFTLVFGANEEQFEPARHKVISSSICDAVAIAPVLKVLSDEFPIEQCFITTLHPWLSYQNIMDGPVRSVAHPKLKYDYYPLGRSSIGALIPKPTTVGTVLESLIPKLESRILSLSYRVPTSVVATADISLVSSIPVELEQIIALLKSIDDRLVRCSEEMLISVDYKGETTSSVVDLKWLKVRDKRYIKLMLWYDNEWGYSSRVIDLIDNVSK